MGLSHLEEQARWQHTGGKHWKSSGKAHKAAPGSEGPVMNLYKLSNGAFFQSAHFLCSVMNWSLDQTVHQLGSKRLHSLAEPLECFSNQVPPRVRGCRAS